MDVDTGLKFKDWMFEQVTREDYSYREAGRRIGVHGSTIGHWIAGRSLPDPLNCLKIAEVFKVEPDFVLALAGHRPHPDSDIDLNDPFVHFWASHSRELTEDAKRALMELATPYITARRNRERA